MQLLFYAPHLTAPTVETLREYATTRFTKLARFIPRLTDEHNIRITVERQRHEFILCVELSFPKPIYIEVRHPNLYAAIDNAYDVIRKTITRANDRRRR